MRRGEVWWANIPRAGRRPILLLSRDVSYAVRTNVTVGEITTNIRGIPVEVGMDKSDGLPRECVVNLDNIVTIPMAQLSNLVVDLSPEKMRQVNQAIIYALDLKCAIT